MVTDKRFFIIPIVLLAVSIKISAGDYAEPVLYKLTEIESINFEINGAWSERISSDETPEMCKNFVLKISDVNYFFSSASQISLKEYSHDLDMSRCHASGEISFSNKKKGKWKIDQARRGMINLSDGRNVYFYCSNCRSSVFYE